MPCPKCAPYGGLWMMTDQGLKRCEDCSKGAELKRIEHCRRHGIVEPPVLDETGAMAIVEALSARVDYFPSANNPIGRGSIAEEIRAMCRDMDSALWLVRRMGELCRKWSGVRQMRLIYCSKFRPLDGYEPVPGPEDAFPEGVPSEAESRGIALPPPTFKALPEPEPGKASAADSVNAVVLTLAVAKHLDNVGKLTPPVKQVPILPQGVKTITQADIDAAVLQNRERIAREELGIEQPEETAK